MDILTQSRPRGRPFKGDEALYDRINIRVPRGLMAEIEKIQASRLDRPDKAVIVRELLAEAIGRRQ
jgi:hypothetical protein